MKKRSSGLGISLPFRRAPLRVPSPSRFFVDALPVGYPTRSAHELVRFEPSAPRRKLLVLAHALQRLPSIVFGRFITESTDLLEVSSLLSS